jgi:eukaryotic-like serine/threonine-protein kinase
MCAARFICALIKPAALAGEFHKLLDYAGCVMNFPLGALVRLGLGRAYAMQGDTTKAKAAYQDFLTLGRGSP